MKYIETPNAPKAIGPYSQAVEVNKTLYVSGQLPLDPTNGTIPSDIKTQTLQSLKNIQGIVEQAGYATNCIVKCNVYMKDLKMFPEMNEVYQSFFKQHKPARVTVEVARLPKDALVEIDAICVKD